MATTKRTEEREDHPATEKAVPQPGMTSDEPEHPEDAFASERHDDDDRGGNPLSRFFARLRGSDR